MIGAEFQIPGNQASYPKSRAANMAEAAVNQYNDACEAFAAENITLDELITAAKNLEFFQNMAKNDAVIPDVCRETDACQCSECMERKYS